MTIDNLACSTYICNFSHHTLILRIGAFPDHSIIRAVADTQFQDLRIADKQSVTLSNIDCYLTKKTPHLVLVYYHDKVWQKKVSHTSFELTFGQVESPQEKISTGK